MKMYMRLEQQTTDTRYINRYITPNHPDGHGHIGNGGISLLKFIVAFAII